MTQSALHPTRRRLLALFASLVVVFSTLVGTTQAAQAASSNESCRPITNNVSFPMRGGFKNPILVDFELCVHRWDDGSHRRAAWLRRVSWYSLGGVRPSTPFKYLRVEVRLERNDGVRVLVNCDITALVNADSVNTSGVERPCGGTGARYVSTTSGGWSADGRVLWDNNGGQHGVKQLHGTGLIA